MGAMLGTLLMYQECRLCLPRLIGCGCIARPLMIAAVCFCIHPRDELSTLYVSMMTPHMASSQSRVYDGSRFAQWPENRSEM